MEQVETDVRMDARMSAGRRFIRDYWPLMIITAVLGLLCDACESLLRTNHLELSSQAFFRFVVYTLFLFVLFYAGDRVIAWLASRPSDKPGRTGNGIRLQGQHRFEFTFNRRGFLGSLGVIYLCWLPYLLATFPGVIWYDTQQQLLQAYHMPNVFGDGHLSDHHPVLDTLIFGGFLKFGNLLGFGNGGVFLYALVQSLITAAVLALTVLYLRRIGVPRRLCMAALLFFALFPIFPMYSSAMVKDAVFLPYFLLFSLCFVETARTKGDFLRNRWALTAFIVFAVLMALTKKTGLYVVVVACLFLPFFLPKGRRLRAFMPAIVTALVMTIALPKIVFPAAGIQEGGKQEVLGIAFQQSARLLHDHPDMVSPQDKEIVYKVLGRDVAQRYQWWATDSVKGYSWSEEQNRYLGEYMKVWIKGLVEHPVSYAEAYLSLEQGWLGAPTSLPDGKIYNVTNMYALGAMYEFPEADALGLDGPDDASGLKAVQDDMDWLVKSSFGMLLFSRALWATWLPVFLAYECLRRKKGRRVAWLLPMAATFLFLWVSPASGTIEGMRYLIPMIYVMPLSAASLLARTAEEGDA